MSARPSRSMPTMSGCRSSARRRRSRFCRRSARTTGRRVQSMRSVHLQRGEVVRIGSLTGGAVLYVAVEGGFDIEPVLGSLSTYIRGGFGGWQGRALVAGDWLPLCRASASEREDCELVGLDLSPPRAFSHHPRTAGRLFRRPARSLRSSAPNTWSRPAPTAWACGSTATGSITPGIQHRLRRHRARLDPGTGQRPADRAARRPADHRRLSEDRDRHLRRSAGARPRADRRENRLRAGLDRRRAQALRRELVAEIDGIRRSDRAAQADRRRRRRRRCSTAI